MRVVTILGARPQFIKAGPLSRAFQNLEIEELLVHTGQHYDHLMSGAFFTEFEFPTLWRQLGVGSLSAPTQVGEMMIRLNGCLDAASPDVVLVYGDTNSTLAGALTAAQLGYPVAHVEAGLRSFRREMPEERNRVVSDHLASVRYAPSKSAVRWLADEGLTDDVELVGDVMRDVLEWQRSLVATGIARRLGVQPGRFVLATVHRPRNADDRARREAIISAFQALVARGIPVVWPVHPRLGTVLSSLPEEIIVTDPLSHREIIELSSQARAVVTDSGGLQKEAYWLGVPCITLRSETEWVETVQEGWNHLVDADAGLIIDTVLDCDRPHGQRMAYGSVGAGVRIAADLWRRLSGSVHVPT